MGGGSFVGADQRVHLSVHGRHLPERPVGEVEPGVIAGRLKLGQGLLGDGGELIGSTLGLERNAQDAFREQRAELAQPVAGSGRPLGDRACTLQ